MKKIYNNIQNDSKNNINLINNNTVLQIILGYNLKYIINKKYLSHTSIEDFDEIIYKDVDGILFEGLNNKKNKTQKADDINLIQIKNKSNAIQYIGLSRKNKIIKICPFFYNDLYIRNDCILAFSPEILLETINDRELNNFNLIMRNDLYSMKLFFKTENYKYFHIKKNKFMNENLLDFSNLSKNIFISGNEDCSIIEKRLGINEHIIVQNQSIILFENSISFNKVICEKKQTYVNSESFVEVNGPGLILFENKCGYLRAEINKNRNNKIFFLFIFLLIFNSIMGNILRLNI